MRKFITTANIILFALVVMVGLNLVSFYTLHTTREGIRDERPRIDHVRPEPKPFIADKLDFSKEQTASYEALLREHRGVTKEKKDDIRELKRNLYGLIYLDPDNPEGVRLLDEISAEERSLAEETFDHFRRVRALCNNEQKKKFERVLDQALDMKPHGKKREERKGKD
jgi:hypothetical protein